MPRQSLRIGIIALFTSAMVIAGYVVTENHTKATKARQALLVEKQVADALKNQDRLVERQSRRPAPETAPAPPPQPAIQKDKDKDTPTTVSAAEIEIFKVFKVRLDDTDSWALVFKMLVLTLGTFLGIKLINLSFKRFA